MAPKITVLALDQRYRHILYHFVDTERSAELAALQVDGHIVETTDVDVPIPDTVYNEIRQHVNRLGVKP
jgi:hypothetical protein